MSTLLNHKDNEREIENEKKKILEDLIGENNNNNTPDENEDKEKIGENEENEEKEEKEEKEELTAEQILSNTRVDITFQMNESAMSKQSVQTYQSLPFKEDKPDLDLPYFSPTKYETGYWKIFHSLSFFLFSSILAASTWFYFKEIRNIYHISLTIANTFYVISTFMEWTHFRRGCIGYSNLNSKLKKNIDNSFRARILRSEFGIKYFISFIAAMMLISGNINYFIKNGTDDKKTVNPNNIDNNFIDFNLFGMLTLSLSQIMKLEKMLIENKTNSVKSDFSKSLVEILLFFGSLFYGSSYMIQKFYLNTEDSPLDDFFLIIRAIGNVLFFSSSLILQYRYYLSNYNDLNIDEECIDF